MLPTSTYEAVVANDAEVAVDAFPVRFPVNPPVAAKEPVIPTLPEA